MYNNFRLIKVEHIIQYIGFKITKSGSKIREMVSRTTVLVVSQQENHIKGVGIEILKRDMELKHQVMVKNMKVSGGVIRRMVKVHHGLK